LHEPTTVEQLVAIETFFAERGAPTMHDVTPYAGVETIALLAARGYTPIELSTVLVQPMPDREVGASALRARIIDPAVDGEPWIEATIAGWSAEPGLAEFIRTIASANIKNPAMIHYVVEDAGVAIATGSLGIQNGVALLAGACTIPSARGRGAQTLLLAQRLVDAKARGCTLTMMSASVGSTSQRNAERNGFRVAYTRTKWRRERG
jgi:hypothetical protein